MPTLLLSNTTSSALVARPGDIPQETAPFYEAWADRLLWTLDTGDLAVVPGPTKPAFLDYLCGVLRLDRRSLRVLSLRDQAAASWWPRHNPSLVAQLRDEMAASDSRANWSISSYIRDRDIVEWERVLLVEASQPDAFTENVGELMNTKSLFRCVARAARIPIAEGRVAAPGDELVDAVADMLKVTGAVMVKQDQNSGGDGNLLVAIDPPTRSDGAAGVVVVAGLDRTAVASAVEAHGLHEPPAVPAGCSPAKLVVEVYHPDARSFYVELHIPRDSSPQVHNFGSLRMSPQWSGFEIPARGISAGQQAALLEQAVELARSAQRAGYFGFMNVDAIVTRDGELIINEFNGRAGGATHLHEICRRLVGDSYLHDVVIVTRNGVPCLPSFDQLLHDLQADGTTFSDERGSGVIVLQDNTRATGTIEYMSIGESVEVALHFERRLESALRGALTMPG